MPGPYRIDGPGTLVPDGVAARYRGTFARWHAKARRNGAQDGATVMWALMGAADRHTAAVHGSSGTAEGPAGDTVAFDEITTEEAAEASWLQSAKHPRLDPQRTVEQQAAGDASGEWIVAR